MTAVLAERSPARISLGDLLRLKAAGESIRLATPSVRAVAAGGHLSPFKGRGIEYDESRPYQPGDDLRTMDWRVTARTGKPHTKIFREERNRPVFVWLDLRWPMMFATRGAFKGVRAAELAGLIAWSAVANGDRLGGLVFSESEHHERRPAQGLRAALRLLQLISADAFWERRPGREPLETDAQPALERLTRVARPGSLVFLLSDFRQLGSGAERYVRQLAAHSDLFLGHVFDPLEAELPPPGRYRIRSRGRSFAIETSEAALRERYRERFEARRAEVRAFARYRGVRCFECATNDDPRAVLAREFRRV